MYFFIKLNTHLAWLTIEAMLCILTLIVTYQLLLKQSKFHVINICVIVTINRKIGNSRKLIFPLFENGGIPPFRVSNRRYSAERRTK